MDLEDIKEYLDGMNMAIITKELLKDLTERHKARQVRYEADGYSDGELVYDMAFCPECNREFEYNDETWETDYCPCCGQRLLWEVKSGEEGIQ